MHPGERVRRLGSLLRGGDRTAWTVVALAVLLAAGVGVGIALGRGGEEAAPSPPAATGAPPPPPATTEAPPPATTAPPPATTAPPPPPATTAPPPPTGPPEGFAVWDVRVAELTPVSARVAWRTTRPARSRLAWGLAGGGSTLWGAARGDEAMEHEAVLPALSPSTAYTVSLTASRSGETTAASIDVQTPPLPADVSAATEGGVLELDGQPFFPLMVWSQCPEGFDANLAAGITLFAANPCGGIQDQLVALSGRGLSAAVSGEAETDGPGFIGWFYEDEPDLDGLTGDVLPVLPLRAGEVSFLTLSNHFYSGAAPLDWGRGIYPGLVQRADIVGFDLYPLQEWCDFGRIGDVYDSQRELVELASGKPTFQWIEAAGMRCDGPANSVTPDTVRAESWLAIAGGADGLGFFPPSHSAEVSEAIALLSRQVKGLAPALLSPEARAGVESDTGAVRAGARSYNGALYAIAVNAGPTSTRATLEVPGLAGRTLLVLDENRSVESEGDRFTDDFGPLAAHVYLVPPTE